MSSAEVTKEQMEKNSFGKEKIILDIPKFTDVLIITTISRTKTGGINVNTRTYSTEQIEGLLKGDK